MPAGPGDMSTGTVGTPRRPCRRVPDPDTQFVE